MKTSSIKLAVIVASFVAALGCDTTNGLRQPETAASAVDDRNVPQVQCLRDVDGDGYSGTLVNPREIEEAGGCPADSVEWTPLLGALDCDDLNWSINPGATEVCDDGIDNNCDGLIDAADPECEDDIVPDPGSVLCYPDVDGDTWGRSGAQSFVGATCPTGYANRSGDCNDNSLDGAMQNPGRTEVCNGIDDDCDGNVDEGAVCGTAQTWYRDQDGDTYGDNAVTVTAVTQPSGHVSRGGDCDDGSAAVNPGATEICDGEDNDCDGSVDEGGVCDTDPGIERVMEVCWTRTSSVSDRNLQNASDGTIWFTGENATGGTQTGSFTTVCKCGMGTPGELAEGNVTFSSTDHRNTVSGPVRERVPTGWSVWWAASNNNGRLMQVGDFYVDYTCNNRTDGNTVSVTVFPSGGGAGARWTNPPAP